MLDLSALWPPSSWRKLLLGPGIAAFAASVLFVTLVTPLHRRGEAHPRESRTASHTRPGQGGAEATSRSSTSRRSRARFRWSCRAISPATPSSSWARRQRGVRPACRRDKPGSPADDSDRACQEPARPAARRPRARELLRAPSGLSGRQVAHRRGRVPFEGAGACRQGAQRRSPSSISPCRRPRRRTWPAMRRAGSAPISTGFGSGSARPRPRSRSIAAQRTPPRHQQCRHQCAAAERPQHAARAGPHLAGGFAGEGAAHSRDDQERARPSRSRTSPTTS